MFSIRVYAALKKLERVSKALQVSYLLIFSYNQPLYILIMFQGNKLNLYKYLKTKHYDMFYYNTHKRKIDFYLSIRSLVFSIGLTMVNKTACSNIINPAIDPPYFNCKSCEL